MSTSLSNPHPAAPVHPAVPSRTALSTIRVGIIGGGKMAQHHARAVGRVAGARVAAIVDPMPAAREEMLRIAPGAAAFASLDEMLAAGGIDLVHVVTPPATHFAVAKKALEAGCHVYVEKPFVERMDHAEELVTLARTRGLGICAGHQLLHEKPARIASALLPTLGKLAHVESYFSFRTARRAPGGRVPLRADQQLLDILPHPVYLLLDVLERCGAGKTEIAAVEVGESGTVHAIVKRGAVTGTLVVTLEGRPIESYLRLVGANGSIFADFVRGTVQRHIGPGISGIDKLVAPYRQGWQMISGTTSAMYERVRNKQTSYPGLAELFEAFYKSTRGEGPPPVTENSLLETTRIWTQVAARVEELQQRVVAVPEHAAASRGPVVVLTGATGFVGKEVARTLAEDGFAVRALARREPPSWERIPGVEYRVADLAKPMPAELFAGAETVIHAAAETAGGWDEHQRNSIDATEQVIRAAAAAGVKRVIHVSSLAVLASGRLLSDDTPLEPDSKGSGPYVWGKLESERLALALGKELGVEVKIVRPGAVVDYREFDPPGRLGKRIGNVFVAVGSPGHKLGVVDVGFTARSISWIARHFDDAPAAINLLSPELPTKRELLNELRKNNPDLTVVWLPTFILVPLSWGALLAQKLLRPGKPAINVAKVFAAQTYDTGRIAALAPMIDERGS